MNKEKIIQEIKKCQEIYNDKNSTTKKQKEAYLKKRELLKKLKK